MSGKGEIDLKKQLKETVLSYIDNLDTILFIAKSAKDKSVVLNVYPPEKALDMLLTITGYDNPISAWFTGTILDVLRNLAFQDAEVFQSLKSIIEEVENNVDISIKEIEK